MLGTGEDFIFFRPLWVLRPLTQAWLRVFLALKAPGSLENAKIQQWGGQGSWGFMWIQGWWDVEPSNSFSGEDSEA